MIADTGFAGRLVFAHQYEAGSPGKWRIESIDMGSKQRRNLRGSGTNNDVNPVWSPDGHTIAFATEVNNNRDIWLMDADGSDAYRLTSSPVKQQYAAWSADGTAVVFTYSRSKTTAGLYQMDLDGSDGRDLGEGGNASWSKHNTIIFSLGEPYSHDVWSMRSDGSNRSNITNTPNINEEFAIWSPDGTQIAFVANPVTNNSADDLERRQIWIMNADGSNRRQLTSGSAASTNPTWSPDGRSIAFVSRRGSSTWQVWVMNADGSDQTQLTSDEGRKFYVSWGRS